jgi:cytochrome c oxidase assembly protein subunit 15
MPPTSVMTKQGFRTLAWASVAVTLAVILWGAYVRASGSGAGCGSHWPLCNGEILPRPKTMETIVELTHRLTSGAVGLMTVLLLIWAFVALPKRHPARAGAVASLVLMLNEGAVGAALVLLEHVAHDKSAARAVWTSLHLANTFLLLAALVCTAYWAAPTGERVPRMPRLAGQGAAPALLGAAVLGVLLTGVSGGVTALGDTLFTSTSLARGIADDFSPTAHFLQQLRVLHPIVATLAAVFVLYARGPIAAGRGPDAARFSKILGALVVGQLLLGVVNFALQAPVAMQLVHLLTADLVWMALVLLGVAALAADPVPAPAAPAATTTRVKDRAVPADGA